MRRLHRAFAQTAFFFLALFPVALNPSAIARRPLNPAGQITPQRPDADSIILPVTVTDKKGNPIDGLDKTAFSIYENKVLQKATFFAGADEPVSIGIILDLSGSQSESKTAMAVRNAVLRFIELSHSDNQYFIIPFAARVRLLIDWTRDSKTAAEEFRKYDFTPRRGNTALYDACYLALEKMRSGAHYKRVILLVTDGQDNNSQYTFTEVRERLKETGVMLYSIGIFSGHDPGSSLGIEGQDILKEFSSISGGMAFFPENKQKVEEIFDRIALELRHQYVLGFKPSKDKADGKYHQIKIKVTPPLTAEGKKQSLLVRSREGYYAAKNLR